MNYEQHHNVDILEVGQKTFVLVGTAHVSRESASLVEEVIHHYQPDTVCLELCEPRLSALQDEDRWKNTDIIEVIKSGRMYVLVAQLVLAGFQKRLAEKFGIRPGEEMRVGLESAKKIGANVAVVDREVKVTLRRAWAKASVWSMIKIFFSMLAATFSQEEVSEEEIEKLKTGDALADVMYEFGKFLPGVKEALIDERDLYMAHKIRNCPGNTIVAVLGAGHIPGIKTVFEQDIEIAPLEEIPPRSLSFNLVSWGIPIAIVAIIVAGFLLSGVEASKEMFFAWVIANGSLSAIGALLALAHPVTILTAFIAAPITSLNPTIAAGTVCAFVEAWFRKPRVSDLQTIAEDINSLSGLWGNRLGRIILVFFLSSLGSAIGTFVGAGWIVSIFARSA